MRFLLSFLFLVSFISLFFPLFSSATRYEAESGTLSGGTATAKSVSGYSGSGFVTKFETDGSSVTIKATISTTGLYKITIGHMSPSGEKQATLKIGSEISNLQFINGKSWTTVSTKSFLQAGTIDITIVKNWGYYYIDYIDIDAASTPSPPLPPSSATLSNTASTASTVALYKYLISQYGKKVLSGQQEIRDINYIQSVSGLTTAIGAFDLIDYSPSRRINHNFFGKVDPTGDATTEAWINWAKGSDNKNNGIITLCWHWNSPTDLIDSQESGKEWYSGFYAKATNFNIASVLAAGANDYRYKALISDIDTIAVELKKLRDADIPILWRPLHEAYGQWFWWGSQGSTAFKSLWNILYDRLTNYHGLNNLIWVYNGEAKTNSEWTPDESKWDIYSLDLYLPNDATDPASWSSEWEAVLSKYNGKRLIALSETGSLPTPSRVKSFSTYWSYAITWNDKFIRGTSTDRINEWMKDSNVVITRSALPDWRTINPSTTTAPPSTATPSVFGIFWNSDRLFDIKDGANTNGQSVQIWYPNSGTAGVPSAPQKFEWFNGEQIRWYQTSKCLDVTSGNNVNGNNIIIWDCSSNNGNANQRFIKKLIRDNIYQIQWKNTDKCLDGGSWSIGNKIFISTCDSNNANQYWMFAESGVTVKASGLNSDNIEKQTIQPSSPSEELSPSSSSFSLSLGMIIGIAIGGVSMIVLIAVGIIIYKKKYQKTIVEETNERVFDAIKV